MPASAAEKLMTKTVPVLENAAHRVATGQPVAQLEIETTPSAEAALVRLGRTEDIRLSPDGRHLAVLGFHTDLCTIFGVQIDHSRAIPRIRLTSASEIRSAAISQPHGVDFINDRTIVLANRGGGVDIYRLPPEFSRHEVLDLMPIRRIRRANWRRSFRLAGSVCFSNGPRGRAELLVCDNAKHTVTRHRIGAGGSWALLGRQLVREGLDIPDGVTMSPDGRWMAVSNHIHHEVFFYDRLRKLGPTSKPDGVARGTEYPHGLRFSPDGESLVVADAGQPFVSLYVAPDGNWSGEREAMRRLRVMDDQTFIKGRNNPKEGGPKGLEIDSSGTVLLLTSDCQRLAAFHIPTVFA